MTDALPVILLGLAGAAAIYGLVRLGEKLLARKEPVGIEPSEPWPVRIPPPPLVPSIDPDQRWHEPGLDVDGDDPKGAD